MHISFGGAAASTTVNSGGGMHIYSGGAATSTTVNSGGGMHIYSGGGATSTTVNSGGGMHIYSGGLGSATTISAYGSMYVSNGGSASGILLGSNGYLALQKADAASVTISRGGSSYISGGTIRNLTLLSRGSASVSNVIISGAEVYSSGRLNCSSYQEGQMIISGAIIRSDGQITMSSGTSIYSAVVSKAGTLNLENGGSAFQTAIDEEGKFTMLGVAQNTVLNGGSMFVGDSAYRDYDGTGGMPTSNVYNEDIHASVNVLNSSWMHIYSGGTATSNTISSNSWAHVYWGGTATSNVINSSGYLTLQDSGTADTTVLHSGGYMRLYAGAILKGETRVGGKVTVTRAGTSATEDVIRAYGAKINFLVTERTIADESIITDLGMIMGATYFVTVSATQKNGTYRLADGATDFTGSITVKLANGTTYGEISIGESLSVSGATYQLNLNDDTLTLRISGTLTGQTMAKSDVNGNGVSDVLFQYTGGDNQLGFWLDGTSEWLGQGLPESADWDVIGAYDMSSDGQADVVMLGNVAVSGIQGAFVGYRKNGDMSTWENISYLTNAEGIDWQVKVGNLTGNAGQNSILWHAPELGAVGVWTDGTDNWVSLGAGYDRNWEMIGTGDFDGDGADSILFSYADGAKYYSLDIDQTATELGASDSGWEVRAIGDFSGDGRDDMVAFHAETGLVAKWENGNSGSWSSLGQLDAADWFIVGAGDYNGDGTDDLLVRQYSTGMLGYYADADLSKWNEIGRGVDMNWTVVA